MKSFLKVMTLDQLNQVIHECAFLVSACAFSALHATHCTLYSAHCALHSTHCALHSTHCALHIAHCMLHTTHCAPHFALCTLHIARQQHKCALGRDGAVADARRLPPPRMMRGGGRSKLWLSRVPGSLTAKARLGMHMAQ